MMTYSNLKSEQINENLEIVMDYGEILNKDELVNILLENFPNTEEKDGILYGKKKAKSIASISKISVILAHRTHSLRKESKLVITLRLYLKRIPNKAFKHYYWAFTSIRALFCLWILISPNTQPTSRITLPPMYIPSTKRMVCCLVFSKRKMCAKILSLYLLRTTLSDT